MVRAPVATNEPARIQNLYQYNALTPEPDSDLDNLATLAAETCKTPIALISLIDKQTQWVKAHIGLEETQIPREISFCAHAILSKDILEVSDATVDNRFFDNPFVTGTLQLKFYAGVPLINEEGFALGTLCVIDTNPRILSEEQKRILRVLGQQVIKNLELKKLKQEVKAAKEQMLHQAKASSLGELAGGISHEINNPLSVILMRSSMLLRTIENGTVSTDQLKTNLIKIQETSRRIDKIISGLKAYCRDGSADSFIDFEICSLITDVLDFCQDKFACSNIKLEVLLPQEKLKTKGSITQISQVLVNLLNNSYDAIIELPNPWIKLEVFQDKGFINFSVTDSGPGIPKEILRKIMTPFFTTKAVGKGTGLGLSISKNIIELHKGKMFLDKKSANTRFIIKLPASK